VFDDRGLEEIDASGTLGCSSGRVTTGVAARTTTKATGMNAVVVSFDRLTVPVAR
jgi:hypothetical protein